MSQDKSSGPLAQCLSMAKREVHVPEWVKMRRAQRRNGADHLRDAILEDLQRMMESPEMYGSTFEVEALVLAASRYLVILLGGDETRVSDEYLKLINSKLPETSAFWTLADRYISPGFAVFNDKQGRVVPTFLEVLLIWVQEVLPSLLPKEAQTKTVAESLFEARNAKGQAKRQVNEALQKIWPAVGFHWIFDSYDESIEIYGPSSLSEEGRRILEEIGFARVWLHDHAYAGSRTGHPDREGDCGCRSIILRDTRKSNR